MEEAIPWSGEAISLKVVPSFITCETIMRPYLHHPSIVQMAFDFSNIELHFY